MFAEQSFRGLLMIPRSDVPSSLTNPRFVLCVLLMMMGFTLTPWPARADTGGVEKSGDILRTQIPAVAYGTTFYLHDRNGRMQFYKGFFNGDAEQPERLHNCLLSPYFMTRSSRRG